MLKTELIDTVNSGSAWAFVGSGVSVDAGYPSWRGLVELVMKSINEDKRRSILDDVRYQNALEAEQYDACFSAIERGAGRTELEQKIREHLAPGAKGAIASILASWPFAAYATSNYDSLLEKTLRDQPGVWIPVGNTDAELPKVSRDATGVVWHVHGAAEMGADKSRLVLTVQDYDSIYVDTSRLHRQMAGVLTQRRIVFVGFGFKDPEFVRLLKLVARYTDPARPIIAFLSEVPNDAARRLELLEDYNVEVIPYRVVNGSHADLLDQLKLYGTFILTRSLHFGRPARECPSYDSETTALLTYNRLARGDGARLTTDTLGALIRARILANLRARGRCTLDELTRDLLERTEILRAGAAPGAGSLQSFDSALAMIAGAIGELQESNLLANVGEAGNTEIVLTSSGEKLVHEQAAQSTLFSDKFRASVRARADGICAGHDETAERVAKAGETFLVECVTKRALGVAMAWNAPSTNFQQYHMLALLQQLPYQTEELADLDDARHLISLITDVLTQPTTEEAEYLGLLMQAQFGLHLLGFNPDATAARIRELSETAFVLDATSLIPLLGRSSVGHAAARQLLHEINRVGGSAISSDLLAEEVAEHAGWAQRQVGQGGELLSLRGLAASTGKAGGRTNVFIEGCVAEAEQGQPLDLSRYLDSVCGSPLGHTGASDVFQAAIKAAGVPCPPLSGWDGFQEIMWDESDEVQKKVKERRVINGTFTHDRQVQAEAEVVVIVRYLREGVLGLAGRQFKAAYFVSQTRIIDDMAGGGPPLTMRPQAVQQWLSTVMACPPAELQHIVDGMLWELTERGIDFVNKTRIATVFGSLITAAKEQLTEELTTNRNLIVQRYGESAVGAFADTKSVDLPFVSEGYFAAKSKELERRLASEKTGREAAERRSTLTQQEKAELDNLRATRRAVEARNKAKRRKAQAKPTRRKKK